MQYERLKQSYTDNLQKDRDFEGLAGYVLSKFSDKIETF